MHIELFDSKEKVTYDIYPTISYESFCNYLSFPEPEFDPDLSMIVHELKIVASLELLRDENNFTQEIEDEIRTKYKIDEDSDLIEIAKVIITEFPNQWKEEMEVSWFYWLDALNGDHAVIGTRADEILNRELYDDPFDYGSLFYIQSLEVQPPFRGENLGIKLIQYGFKYLIRTSNGMVFVIAQEPFITSSKKEKRSLGLVDYYETLGFTRAFNSKNQDLVMEIEISKLRDLG